MNTTRRSLLEVPASHRLLRVGGGLTVLATLGTTLWLGWQAALEVAQGMLRVGWGAALGAKEPVELILRCNTDFSGRCAGIFSDLWQRALPLDTLRLVVAGGFALGVLPFLVRPWRPRKSPGQGRWATAGDLAGYLGKGVGWYGLFEGKPLRVPAMERRTGTLVVGKPGGGKTTGYFQPNLLLDARDGWSAVVFDLKWPDEGGLMEAVGYFRRFGRPVYAYTPFAEGSARIALLEGAEDPQEASNIADILVPRGVSGGAEFYANLERMLLAGLVWIEGQEGRYSLRHILEVLRRGKEELEAYAEVRPQLRERIGAVLQTRSDVAAGVVAGLAGKLALFEHEHLDRSSSPGRGQVPWERLFTEPSLLYIGIPQEHLEGGKATALLWLVKRILDREIHRAAARNKGVLKALTSVYLDEFTAFGKLPGVEDNLKTMRSKGVAFHVSLQNLANGRSVYGRDAWESIQGTFGQQVYLLERLSEEDRRWLARVLGYETVVGYSRSSSRSGFLSGSEGEGEREEARLLLSAEEMREARRGEAVVILDGKPPVRTRLGGMWERNHPLHGLYVKVKAAVHLEDDPLSGRAMPVHRTDDPLSGRQAQVAVHRTDDPLSGRQLQVAVHRAADPLSGRGHPAPVHLEDDPHLGQGHEAPVHRMADSHDPQFDRSPGGLEEYLRRLISTMPTFQRYYQKKTTTGVRFVLPKGFPPPETAWARAGWVEVRGKEELSLHLTSQGLEVLDKGVAAALVRWCRVREWARRQGLDGQAEVLMEEAEAEVVLREWAKRLPKEEGKVRVRIALEALS